MKRETRFLFKDKRNPFLFLSCTNPFFWEQRHKGTKTQRRKKSAIVFWGFTPLCLCVFVVNLQKSLSSPPSIFRISFPKRINET